MYIFPSKTGLFSYQFKSLKALRAVVMEIKRLPELCLQKEDPKPYPYPHPNNAIYHTLTGYDDDLVASIFNAFTNFKRDDKPFKVSLYTYHGKTLHWLDRRILDFPALSQLTRKNFNF